MLFRSNARLGLNNKIVFGYWDDEKVQEQLALWQDTAVGYNESFKIKVCRLGDTMRNVAVTEGDKVEAQIKLGWTVDYWPVGDLVKEVNQVTKEQIDAEYAKLAQEYELVQGDNSKEKYEHAVRYQLREYIAIKNFLERGGYTAFTTNFEDL